APPYLYFTLQTQDSLDIFRLPEGGQTAAPASLEEMRAQFDGLADPHERTYLLRRAQHAFFVDGRKQEAAEAALAELRWIVQENRATEARWLFAKIAANFADDAEIQ